MNKNRNIMAGVEYNKINTLKDKLEKNMAGVEK